MRDMRDPKRNIFNGMNDDEYITINTSYAWYAQRIADLNQAQIANHDGPAEPLAATTPIAANGTTVYFRDLEQHLVAHIRESEVVVGCVAWLTNKSLLDALSQKHSVAIVVQKEDFLRPDLNSSDRWRQTLRQRYDALPSRLGRLDYPGVVSRLSTSVDSSLPPVRCVGNVNSDKAPAFPRMHHKFVVFCHHTIERRDDWIGKSVMPYAVWTGSYNFTENAARSLENATVLTAPEIVWAFYEEWARIEAISEPLDWESEWVAPQWRLGT